MRTLMATALLLAVAACGGSVVGPDNQLEVTNVTDNFQFQVTALNNVSQTFTYQWTNTGTTANVNQACSISGGNASVTVEDANGTQVYTANLATNGTVATSAGVTGVWTIRVELHGVHGALNFRVQKP